MSLRAIIEVVLHLESFRNIDLFQQGLYYLEFEIFHTLNGKKFSASPYIIHAAELSSKSAGKIPGQLDDTIFKSQSFYIKYCDEDINLNEIAVFRTEVEINNLSEIPHLTVQCSLMYSDLGGRVSEKVLRGLLENPPVFNRECSLEIKILNFIEGVNQFLPIIFDDSHFCLMNCTMHVVLIDFRFRPLPMIPAAEEHPQARAAEKEISIPVTLSEIFFPGSPEVSVELMDTVQQKYIRLLTVVHDKYTLLITQLFQFLDSKVAANMMESLNQFSISDTTVQGGSNLKSWNQPLSTRIAERDPSGVSEKILLEIQEIAGSMHYLLYTFIDVLKRIPKEVSIFLMHEFNIKLKDRWGESIFRNVNLIQDFCDPGEHNLGATHKSTARKLRQSEYYQNMEQLPISVTNYYPNPEFHPILFLDVCSKVSESSEMQWEPDWVKFTYSRLKPSHLVVFVHGFQGNSFDVRLIRNQVALWRPDTILMCSHMNEGETEGDIAAMGERLAEEVIQYIHEWCPKNQLEKISFIGHSLGGLIIRASLPHLKSLAPKFHFYITFSSPHLGYMYNSSKIVDAGLWIIKKWKKSECLKQLSMTDTTDPKNSFLYRLSNLEGIEWFKNIALVGSFQDNYAPFESARIEVGHKAASDSKGKLYNEMARNLLSRVNAQKILRIDANLKLKAKNLDSMIGRAAHIQMLDNNILVQMVMHCCASFFQ